MGSVNPKAGECTVGAIGSDSGATRCVLQSSEQILMQAIDQLTHRLSQLEEQVAQQKYSGQQGNTRRPPNRPLLRDQTPAVTCYHCGKEGHYMPEVMLCAVH